MAAPGRVSLKNRASGARRRDGSMDGLSQFIVANLPAIICLIAGFVLVVIEMFIPGFGLPGISGIILLIVGVALKARSPLEALIIAASIILLLCIALSFALRSAARGRLSRSSLILSDVSKGNASEVSEGDLKYFIGRSGRAVCALRPAGIAEFDGVKLNVVSDGEFISENSPVRVERVEGNRIVVRRLDADGHEV